MDEIGGRLKQIADKSVRFQGLKSCILFHFLALQEFMQDLALLSECLAIRNQRKQPVPSHAIVVKR